MYNKTSLFLLKMKCGARMSTSVFTSVATAALPSPVDKSYPQSPSVSPRFCSICEVWGHSTFALYSRDGGSFRH